MLQIELMFISMSVFAYTVCFDNLAEHRNVSDKAVAINFVLQCLSMFVFMSSAIASSSGLDKEIHCTILGLGLLIMLGITFVVIVPYVIAHTVIKHIEKK